MRADRVVLFKSHYLCLWPVEAMLITLGCSVLGVMNILPKENGKILFDIGAKLAWIRRIY